MKFGKRLKQQTQESLPEWRDKFLSYKDLKKLVRLISAAPPPRLLLEYGKTEAEFVYLLNNEIDKFNGFFMEKEEDFIIRHKDREVSSLDHAETSRQKETAIEELACLIR